MDRAIPDKHLLLRDVLASREKWGSRPSDVTPEPVGPGEESVWDYPRPPVIKPAEALVSVVFAGREVARSERAVRVMETAGAPVYYLPPDDVDLALLKLVEGYSVCEWKGAAVYFDVVVEGRIAERAAFSYPDPFDDLKEGYTALARWIGFYPARMDACFVGKERALSQPGSVYAGWVLKKTKGPIKGAPGSSHW